MDHMLDATYEAALRRERGSSGSAEAERGSGEHRQVSVKPDAIETADA
jgi:hypothetical protein